MKISLIIPAYNEEKYIGPCLESVVKNGTGLFEVIVINNASTDKTKQVVEKFLSHIPNLRLVDENHKGLPFARARGLTEARGDLVAYIDADARMPAGWLNQIFTEFENNPNLVCLSGPYKFYDANFSIKFGAWFSQTFIAMPMYFITRYMVIAGNFVSRKDIFIKAGGINQDIAFYGDDTDIARRLSKAGKVKFSLRFYMYTSARRLKGDGALRTGYTYAINFLSVARKGKPTTHEHADHR